MSFSKKSLYNIYINFFTQKGKKSVAKKNIDRSLLIVSQYSDIPVSLILYVYLCKLNILVETRKVSSSCIATIGTVSNPDQKNIKIGKAGRSRWLGRRPHTRGVVMNPVDHPHGGGEGKSAGGRHPVSRTGQSAKGLKTRDNKRTDKFIIRRRKKKKG